MEKSKTEKNPMKEENARKNQKGKDSGKSRKYTKGKHKSPKNGGKALKPRRKVGRMSNTPYDDVFRTLLNDCSRWILPVLNEVFGENYTGQEEILFSNNEHFINMQDGEEEKRITDTSFSVAGICVKRYSMECQATAEDSLLIRFFEYATQIALDQGAELVGNTLRVRIPACAVLFLRSTGNTPNKMHVEIICPEDSAKFDVSVMKVQDYGLEEIFEKNLLFLIPFYIFTHEKKLKEYDSDESKLKSLKKEYEEIMKRLEAMEEKGSLSVYQKRIIIEMSRKVLEHLAAKYENVKKGVTEIMGGRILQYEAKTIYQNGEREGEKRGKKIGEQRGEQRGEKKRIDGLVQTVKNLMLCNEWTMEETMMKMGMSKADREVVSARMEG